MERRKSPRAATTEETLVPELADYNFELGTVQGAKGLKGDLKLRSSTDFNLYCDIKKVALVTADGATTLINVRSLKQEGKSILIAFKEYPDRTAAEKITGCRILAKKADLSDLGDDEWWIDDLVGLTAFKEDGTKIGVISSVYSGATQLLEISDGSKEYLVPFVKALVPKVDIKAGRVEIVDMPGLLE